MATITINNIEELIKNMTPNMEETNERLLDALENEGISILEANQMDFRVSFAHKYHGWNLGNGIYQMHIKEGRNIFGTKNKENTEFKYFEVFEDGEVKQLMLSEANQAFYDTLNAMEINAFDGSHKKITPCKQAKIKNGNLVVEF